MSEKKITIKHKKSIKFFMQITVCCIIIDILLKIFGLYKTNIFMISKYFFTVLVSSSLGLGISLIVGTTKLRLMVLT